MKRIVIVLTVIVVLAAAGTAQWVYRDLHRRVSHARTGQFIEINRGSSPSTVVKKLSGEGIIKNEWPISIYLKLTGAGSRFRAGEYDFPSPISPLEVIAKLETGEQRFLRLTVVEGWSRWEIAAAMARIPELNLSDSDAALKLMDDTSLVRDLDPNAENLEGYLYPATYEFARETTPTDLIEQMVKRFRLEWKPAWTDKAEHGNDATSDCHGRIPD